MSDIDRFCGICGCDRNTAKKFIELYGDVDHAIGFYFDNNQNQSDDDSPKRPLSPLLFQPARSPIGNPRDELPTRGSPTFEGFPMEKPAFEAFPTVGNDTEETTMDDFTFYQNYSHIVDNFCQLVMHQMDLADLKDAIAESTQILKSEGVYIDLDLPNRPSYLDCEEGRTPLSYAVALCYDKTVRDLISLGADPRKVMNSYPSGEENTTALTVAVMNEDRDGTEMVRLLLCYGSKPEEVDLVLKDKESKKKYINITMRYWLNKAKEINGSGLDKIAEHYKEFPPLDRLHHIHFSVVGQDIAISEMEEHLISRFGNQTKNAKPLVLLLLGPPGHGKTYLSRNLSKSLVGEDNFLEIAMGSIRDDADLFGSKLGGATGGDYSSDGQLTKWLRTRQNRNTIVFLDEFEKPSDLTNALGWGQSKKIYQSFLETWQEGTLSDQGKNSHVTGNNKINCSKTIWILTSNWGQEEIIQFAENNSDRVYHSMNDKDVRWVQSTLGRQLKKLVQNQFKYIHSDIQALARRIDGIIPFLPFTITQQKVVADTALREYESSYREPCVKEEDNRRCIGNVHLQHTKGFVEYAIEEYEPMHGASTMVSAARRTDGKFHVAFRSGQLNITEKQYDRLISFEKVDDEEVPEPKLWFHFDKETDRTVILSYQPEESDDEEEEKDETKDEEAEEASEFLIDQRSSLAGSKLLSGSFLDNSKKVKSPFKKK